MKRLQTSLFAAAGILILALVLTAIGPKQVMAAIGFTPVRDVDNPGRQPFSINLTVSQGMSSTFPIPAGKRLVITHVDAFTDNLPDTIAIRSTVNGGFSEIGVGFSRIDTPAGFVHYRANEQVMGFADPGTSVSVSYFTFSFGVSARVNIHGYFVDVP
jgi:hypothetical protein